MLPIACRVAPSIHTGGILAEGRGVGRAGWRGGVVEYEAAEIPCEFECGDLSSAASVDEVSNLYHMSPLGIPETVS